jgi:hypothetical protein
MNNHETPCILFIKGHKNIHTHLKPTVCTAVNLMIKVAETQGYGKIFEEVYKYVVEDNYGFKEICRKTDLP